MNLPRTRFARDSAHGSAIHRRRYICLTASDSWQFGVFDIGVPRFEGVANVRKRTAELGSHGHVQTGCGVTDGMHAPERSMLTRV